MRKAIIKTSVLGMALMSLAISSNAQWTRNAVSGFIYPTVISDKIGIGTNTPSYQLDIKQPGVCSFRIQSQTSGSSNLILSRSAAAGQNCLVNYKTGTTDLWRTGAAGNDNFSIINGTGNTNFLISQASGNVGIGTTTPQTKLDVAGQAHVMVDNSASDYTSSNVRMESSPSSAFFPSASFNLVGYGAMKLYGSTYLEVADNAGGYTSVSATAFNVVSDLRMKKNVNDISVNDYSEYMKQIRAIQSITYLYNDENVSNDQINKNKIRVAPHVGFSAQSLPNTITAEINATTGMVNSEKRIGYNLSDMAGLTLIGIKALDAKTTQLANENEALKKANADLQSQLNDMKSCVETICNSSLDNASSKVGATAEQDVLFQNQPNPFNSVSVIRYSLVKGNAQIIIRDLSGNTIKSFNLAQSGKGQVTVNANELAQGTYTYSMVVNGNAVDTKLMVITK